MWHRSIALVEATYLATDTLPREETYGLKSQMRRAAVSIPSNIAEGAGNGGARSFARYLHMAYGSACELETQFVVAGNLGLIDCSTADPLLAEIDGIRRMLHSLANRTLEESGTPDREP